MSNAPVRVVSEIGRLRTVIVHTPGRELLAVTPGTREEYLYDDIIELEAASTEHDVLVSVLERFAKVHQVRHLLGDIADDAEVRAQLVGGMSDVVRVDSVTQRLVEASPDAFIDLLIHGDTDDVGPIATALNEPGFVLPAQPNLFFTRDIGIVIGSQVCIGAMRYEARWSEELLFKTLFTSHPALANDGMLYDGSLERSPDRTVEGGDIHPVRDDLLIVGCSNRTSSAGLDHLCELLFANGDVTDVIVVIMPGEPTAIHLDMLFTQVDREQCVVSPRHFIGLEALPVLHRRKGEASLREPSDFFAALSAVNHDLEPIWCGGALRSRQEREQWASGCNLFAVKPGVAIAYRRNDATLDQFASAGYAVVDAEEWLAGPADPDALEKTILTIRGSELVRGGGGPRCMTMPVLRDE